MTSRQRVAAALDHRTPDRVPLNYLAKRGIDRRLREHYGVEGERGLLDALGCDVYFLSARDISQNETTAPIYRGPKLWASETERVCPFGIRFQRGVGDDKFGADEALAGPLGQAKTPREVLAHPWPDPAWFDPEPLLAECEEFRDRFVIGGFWSAIFGDAYRMLGFERFLLNLALNPPLIKTLIERLTEFYLELNERMFRALKGKLDVFFFGNDFGTQSGLLISRQMWSDFYFEPYRRLAALARSYGLRVMTHSCGGVFELIDLMIEAGVEILDPVQTTAAGMDPAGLKVTFGKRLCFHGAVDTQQVLNRASPEEVAAHARELIAVLGAGGGYILASCNSIQDDTPVENIDALYRTARETPAGECRVLDP